MREILRQITWPVGRCLEASGGLPELAPLPSMYDGKRLVAEGALLLLLLLLLLVTERVP